MVPGLWFLSQAGANRIFENKTSVDLVNDVIDGYGAFCTLDLQVNKDYIQREYCVQFNESDLAFVQRLLAEDGIAYYFTHTESDHALVLSDALASFTTCAEEKVVARGHSRVEGAEGVVIHEWHRTLSYHSPSCELLDYNQDTPKNFYPQHVSSLSQFSQSPSVNSMQHYGGYNFKSGDNSCHDFDINYNKQRTQHWVESLESSHDVAQGSSSSGRAV